MPAVEVAVMFPVLLAFTNKSWDTVEDAVEKVATRLDPELEYISRFEPNTLAGKVQSPAVASALTLEDISPVPWMVFRLEQA